MTTPAARVLVLAGCAWLLAASAPLTGARAGTQVAPAPVPPTTALSAVRATLDRYCLGCHNDRLRTGGLSLATLDPSAVGGYNGVWERVVRKLRTHEMPPAGAIRPDDATYRATAEALERALDAEADAHPQPGRVAVHRLSRTEYANAVRDLLGIDLPASTLLPADEPDQQTFDNVASVLSVSPALLENYLSAAYRVSRLAVADPSAPKSEEVYTVPTALTQDERVSDDLPFGTQGGIAVRHQFPAPGDYSITVTLRRQLYRYIIGMGEPHQIDVRLDGVRLRRFTIGGEGRGLTAPESFAGNTQGDPPWEVYMHTADEDLQVRVPVAAGSHEISVSFVRRFWEPEGILQPRQRGFARTTNELYHGEPAVDTVAVAGPLAPAAQLSGNERVFVCRPSQAAAERDCARRILERVATRAYRRPVTAAELDTVLRFYDQGRADAGFDAGIQRGLERVLAAPSFLFRVVREPAGLARGAVFPLSDLELASRLSFFVWSSVPDDALRLDASRGRLHEPAVLQAHVRRMLAAARSRALVDSFALQWLKVGKVAGVVPDVDAFPEFDENLRRAMLEETRLFLADQIEADRPVPELVTADYSFLNDRLAKHYGVANVYGSHFRRVSFASTSSDGVRGGLLGQASVLTTTSYPNRTSPVLRGRWLLDTVLGSPPPPPPPDVPTLEQASPGRVLNQREQMEAHRKSPACATCHVRMDPLGFSMEQFDALGQWRVATSAGPIDASATLPDGSRFDGARGLRTFLTGHREDFVRTFTEKLLAYALGRGLEPADMPAVRRIVREASSQDYRWSSILNGIVTSVPFRFASERAGS
ncbi:MAG TPA: DUF1592 domain-containing protein [Vicinamibacterales bacterium]|jgi:hypothetical protein|nr:DUF1592 domain-containing protein [Vicinamibacterales bacterium]